MTDYLDMLQEEQWREIALRKVNSFTRFMNPLPKNLTLKNEALSYLVSIVPFC